MPNDISQDPLYFDGAATDVKIRRIRAVKFSAAAAATASITDADTGHIIWSTVGGTFDEINVTIPGDDPKVDIALSAGALMLYEGSGPR